LEIYHLIELFLVEKFFYVVHPYRNFQFRHKKYVADDFLNQCFEIKLIYSPLTWDTYDIRVIIRMLASFYQVSAAS